MSLPLKRYVSFLWSIPSKCSIVVWRSWTETAVLGPCSRTRRSSLRPAPLKFSRPPSRRSSSRGCGPGRLRVARSACAQTLRARGRGSNPADPVEQDPSGDPRWGGPIRPRAGGGSPRGCCGHPRCRCLDCPMPPWKRCTKRTPRSTSRHAMRHCRPNGSVTLSSSP